MESYLKPEAEIIRFQPNDVISASGGDSCTTYIPNQCEPKCPIEGPGECMLGDDR